MLDKMTNRTEQGEQVNPRILQKNKLKLNLRNAMNTRQRGLMNNHDVLFFFGFFLEIIIRPGGSKSIFVSSFLFVLGLSLNLLSTLSLELSDKHCDW